MAIAKVCGIETEYGILVRGGDLNPTTASSLLINAYVASMVQRVAWDFEDENPGSDARGFAFEDVVSSESDSPMVNAVLTNGARYYVDHAHPEISTPECRTAREVLIYDRAAEEIVRRSMEQTKRYLPQGYEILLYKNNSDGKGNSYGCHENYLMDRHIPFGHVATQITAHFVTRQVFAGAGKVGCEVPGVGADEIPFQISQRADFFEEEVGLETTIRRPIVNTRDEPHCDPSKYRRLHVIVGDANMSEVATYLKVGTTAIVLAMIEDDALSIDLSLAHAVPAVRQVSYDTSLSRTLLLRSGQRMTALEIQWSLLHMARRYAKSHGLAAVEADEGERILNMWEEVLQGLSVNISSVAHQVDWVAKQRLVLGYQHRYGLASDDARLKAIDLQYHDMRIEKCLAGKVGLQTMTLAQEIEAGISEPPASTRAYFRGQCLQRWPEQVIAANWDSMVFDVGHEPLRRVLMMEPLRGNQATVGKLLQECSSLADLLDRLGA